MTQRFQGLHRTAQGDGENHATGLYLVRVARVRYHWHRQKPFYLVQFSILEPRESAGRVISGRIDCTAKALWKLGWFLRDFAYDSERLSRDEVDEKAMVGLHGVVKISRLVADGTSLSSFEGFAPISQWQSEAPVAPAAQIHDSEATQ